MYITRVDLQNFRVYDGHHSLLLLPPSGDRNIYLIGGLNGAGKTSLFSAIVLALYGDGAAGLVFERSRGDDLTRAYERYLLESFSFSARSRGETEMGVGIEFVHDGRTVEVQRRWWMSEEHVEDEDFVVRSDGSPLTVEVDDPTERLEVLEDFVETIAPARVAKFFFFDGEEIRSISSRQPESAVVEGLNQLLGFHALERLIGDLKTLRSRSVRRLPKAAESGLIAAEDELDQISERVQALKAELAALGHAISHTQSKIKGIEDEIIAMLEGRDLSSQAEVFAQLERNQRRLTEITNECQVFISDSLALAMPVELLQKTEELARRELQMRVEAETSRKLKRSKSALSKDVLKRAISSGWELSPEQEEVLRKAVEEAVDARFANRKSLGHAFLSLFSDEELVAVSQAGDDMGGITRRSLRDLLMEKEKLLADTSRLNRLRARLESSDRFQVLVEKKSTYHEELATKRHAAENIRKDLISLEREGSLKSQLISKLREQVRAGKALERELDVIDRMRGATEHFMARLRQVRCEQLSADTSRMMRQLVHKEELVSAVEIDSETFSVRVVDKSGSEVVSPSAGEKEVFALSLVWGLARISLRGLPMIIDTPLGRLDQMHRENFVERFLPQAAEQVIVLSTDSEIDDRWYPVLKPHLAQEVLIDFSDANQTSAFRSGAYFELTRGEGAQHE